MDLFNREFTGGLTLVLLDLAVKGLVLVTAAAGVTLLLRRAPAVVRSLIWNAVVTALVVLPLLTIAGPDLKVPFLPDIIDLERTVSDTEVLPVDFTPPDVSATHSDNAEPQDARAAQPGFLSVPRLPWFTWFVLCWVAGLAVMAGRYLTGHMILSRLRRAGFSPAGDDLPVTLAELSRYVGLAREVRLLLSARTPVAFTSGLRRPVIVLPAEALNWTASAIRNVLIHELAHIRRRDFLFEILCQIAVTLFWFNPAVWGAAGRLRIERERTCDDMVLREGSRPSDYAGQLLELAGIPSVVQKPLWQGAALSQGGSLKNRLLFILDPNRQRMVPGRSLTPTVGIICVCLTLPLGLVAPWQSDETTIGRGGARIEPARSREERVTRLADPDPQVRLAAVRSLGQSGDPAVIPSIFSVICEDHVPAVLSEAVGVFAGYFAGSDPAMRNGARRELDRVGWSGGWFALMKALSQADFTTRETLGRMLAETLTGEVRPELRMAAAEAVAAFPDEALIETDLILLTDEFVKIRAVAASALGTIGVTEKRVQSALNEMARKDPHAYARIAAVEALGKLGTSNAAYICELVSRDDPDPEVRQVAQRVVEALRTGER